MVRFHFRIVEKSYKKGLRVYKHEEVTLNFPKELHELLRVFVTKNLRLKDVPKAAKYTLFGLQRRFIRRIFAANFILAFYFLISPALNQNR